MTAEGSPARRDGESISAYVEARACELVGEELAACERLDSYVSSAVSPWPGRQLDAARGDLLIVAEFGRTRKSYAGALHLVRGGYGPQAAMLIRSLFEGMAIAHWMHHDPELALVMFAKHERHAALLAADELFREEGRQPDAEDAGTKQERAELTDLFGRFGHRPWTGHANLHAVLLDVEHLWTNQIAKQELWTFYRRAHRDNNQILHSSPTALTGGVRRNEDGSVTFDAQPSSLYLDRMVTASMWCYLQTVTLLWDHFDLPDRKALDDEIVTVYRPFIDVHPDLLRATGRNDLCPCGSGRKFKRCHGS